jgi:diguanylate cyclase (GGDEF)-like protein/PAS domain S-box-containing protein
MRAALPDSLKRAEEALRQSDDLFKLLVANISDVYWIMDLNLNYTYISPSVTALRGLSPEEAMAQSIGEAMTPSSVELATRVFAEELARERQKPGALAPSRTLELELLHKDGSTVWAETRMSFLRNENGEARGILGVSRNITYRRRVEENRRESEKQFRAISAAAQDAIIMMDSDENITFWSEAAERIFGYHQNEALGKRIHDLVVPPEYREKFRRALPRWRETGQGDVVGRTVELAALRKDGAEFPIELSLAATLIKGRWNAVGIIRDITARKRAEEELRRANETLSGMVKTLEEQHRRNRDLGEMREFLQASSTSEEIGPVILRSMTKLFPGSAGALFLLSPSRTDLESVARWGDFPENEEDNVFAPDACWALRRGVVYMVDETGGLLCPHLKHPPSAGYVCLPLMAKGDVLGLLHIRNRAEGKSGDTARMVRPWEDVSATLSEMLSLSLSNIRLRETLSNQSIRDPLTGLFNRRYMEENFQREILRAARKEEPIGVVMIDIDHFKTFNDLQGHAAGDRVLVELAGFLQSRMRGADIVCRYGGEEFILILPECTLDNAIRRADQLVADARQMTVQDGGHALGRITLSMGVAAYPAHGTNPAILLAAADAALYKAKQTGRDRVVSA